MDLLSFGKDSKGTRGLEAALQDMGVPLTSKASYQRPGSKNVNFHVEETLLDHLVIPESALALHKAKVALDTIADKGIQEALTFVCEYIKEYGEPPNESVISAEAGYSDFEVPEVPVGYVIDKLIERGQRKALKLIVTGMARKVNTPGEALNFGLVELTKLQHSSYNPEHLVWFTGQDVPDLIEMEWIAFPFAARGARSTFIGDVKAGKTTYLLSLVDAVTTGKPFLGKPTIQMPVVYLSEQTHSVFFQQFPAGLKDCADFHFLTYTDNYGTSWPEFIDGGVQKCLETGSELLIIDTAGKFTQLDADSINAEGSVRKIIEVLDKATHVGITVILAKHERKSGGTITKAAGGSFAWTADFDILIRLIKKEDMNKHDCKLETSGRIAEIADESWLTRYVPDIRSVEMVGGYAETSSSNSPTQELVRGIFEGSEDDLIPRSVFAEAAEKAGIEPRTLQNVKALMGIGSVNRGGVNFWTQNALEDE